MEDLDEAFARLADYFHHPRPATPRGGRAAAPALPESHDRGLRARLRPLAVRGLESLSRRYLRRVQPRCVALAGLRGKTVLKRSLRDLLEPALAVRTNPRSYNTEIGLPLAVLGVELPSGRVEDVARGLARATWRGLAGGDHPDVLVLEMGIRRAGDARSLLGAVTPDILVVTPLAPSFAADLAFLDEVEREITVLARAVAESGGVVFACDDDPRVAAAVASIDGIRSVRLAGYARREDGSATLATSLGPLETTLDAVGESAVYALLAGVEIAGILGVDRAHVERALRREGLYAR